MNDNIDINKLLSEIGEELCPDIEVLSTFSEGSLPDQSSQIIARHLQKCKACRQNVQILKEVANESFIKTVDTVTPPPMPEKLKSKYTLALLLNSCKLAITETIAKSVLPPEYHSTIFFVIRSQYKSDIAATEITESEFPNSMAAFASADSQAEINPYKVINQIMLFVDVLSDMINEKCSSISDLETRLSECICCAEETLGDLAFDDDTKEQIVNVVIEKIKENG